MPSYPQVTTKETVHTDTKILGGAGKGHHVQEHVTQTHQYQKVVTRQVVACNPSGGCGKGGTGQGSGPGSGKGGSGGHHGKK